MENTKYRECITKLCGGSIGYAGEWKENLYCEYIESICNNCRCLYWIIKRKNKYFRIYREKDDIFEDQRSGKFR